MARYGLEIVFSSTFTILLLSGLVFKRVLLKQICFNLAALFFALGLYELYLTVNVRGTYLVKDKEYVTSDALLGYGPENSENYNVNVAKKFKDSNDTIYDVEYGFDDGLRTTPGSNEKGNKFAFFFGGSFVFGEGVNDNETLPSFFAKMNETLLVRNYGFEGYGSHQSLMALTQVILNDSILLNATQGHVFYFFIPDHINRVIGNAIWDTNGPYYYLMEGNLEYGGTFRDLHLQYPPWLRACRLTWFNSKIYAKFFSQRTIRKQHNLDLIIAIIAEMKRLIASRGYNFTVILEYHPGSGKLVESMKNELRTKGVVYIDLKEVIPRDGDPLYLKNDPHPSPKFYEKIAKHLTESNFRK